MEAHELLIESERLFYKYWAYIDPQSYSQYL